MLPPIPAQRILDIGRMLQCIVQNLDDLGFQFANPKAVFPGPELGAEQAITRIEREIGKVPLAIKLFWIHIGSIDMSGRHPGWTGCEYPDPLVVFPPSIAIDELDEFVADREQRLHSNFPYLVPIAPDAFSKADVSGGMWYNVNVPAVADDPPLNCEPHNTTFLGYLDIATMWGGFPGLSKSPQHEWPIAAIVNRR